MGYLVLLAMRTLYRSLFLLEKHFFKKKQQYISESDINIRLQCPELTINIEEKVRNLLVYSPNPCWKTF